MIAKNKSQKSIESEKSQEQNQEQCQEQSLCELPQKYMVLCIGPVKLQSKTDSAKYLCAKLDDCVYFSDDEIAKNKGWKYVSRPRQNWLDDNFFDCAQKTTANTNGIILNRNFFSFSSRHKAYEFAMKNNLAIAILEYCFLHDAYLYQDVRRDFSRDEYELKGQCLIKYDQKSEVVFVEKKDPQNKCLETKILKILKDCKNKNLYK